MSHTNGVTRFLFTFISFLFSISLMFDVVFFSTVGAKIIFLTSASTELLLYCVILEVRCYLENH